MLLSQLPLAVRQFYVEGEQLPLNLIAFLYLYFLNLSTMPILYVLLVLIVVGIILYLINNYVPLDPKIKTIINWVVVIVVIIWLLKVFNVFAALSGVKV